MFSMGSTTKAFTSAVLAMLVDEGKLTWDTKVVDVLPGFRMYDPYASSEMTVRDLLVHRSGLGLGAGDLLLFPPSTLSRAEIVHKLRYIKPATSLTPNPKSLELAQASFRAYALGWAQSDYRDELILAHGGGVLGSVALVVIVPGKDVAFAVLTNSEETSALAAIQYRLLDHYLGVPSPDWITALHELRQARIAKGQETLAASAAAAPAHGDKGPSLALDGYAGRYRDDWYGHVTIEHDSDGLAIRFEHTPALAGRLEHIQYDTFRSRWTDKTLEDAYVTFALQPDGSISTMTMKAISPLADFSFDFHDLLFKPVR